MWILIGVTAVLLVCDRVLKALARSEKLRYRGKLLQLTHLENPGFFLGKGSRYPRLLRWVPLGIWLLAAALLLHLFFQRHKKSAYVSGVLEGLKAASVGLIMSAGGTILLLTFCGTFDWHAIAEVDLPSILLFGAALFVLRKWKMNPILLMTLTGVAGYFIYGLS